MGVQGAHDSLSCIFCIQLFPWLSLYASQLHVLSQSFWELKLAKLRRPFHTYLWTTLGRRWQRLIKSEEHVVEEFKLEISRHQPDLVKLYQKIRGLRVPLVEPQPPNVRSPLFLGKFSQHLFSIPPQYSQAFGREGLWLTLTYYAEECVNTCGPTLVACEFVCCLFLFKDPTRSKHLP